MIHLGEAARQLRKRMGYTLKEAERSLGMSYVHIHKIETGKTNPTTKAIERYYTAWGVDLYMMAVVMFGDGSRVNWIMKETVDELRADWEQQIGEVIRKRIAEKGEHDAE